jgi:hypothetical protein
LLIITAGQFVQSNYISLSILIVVEIIPALVFLVMIDIKSSATDAMKSKMSSGKSSGASVTSKTDSSDDGVIKIPYRE